MKKNLPSGAKKSCIMCEYSRKIEVSGEILCARTKNLKVVSADECCRHFSFDVLEYRPLPAKQPKPLPKTNDEIL